MAETVRPSELIPFGEVLKRQLADPEFRREWERTTLARAVALRLVSYRAEHRLSQTQLAKKLGLKQPAVARLESGEHNPTLETLWLLARTLGIEFLVDVAPPGRRHLADESVAGYDVLEVVTSEDGSQLLVAAS